MGAIRLQGRVFRHTEREREVSIGFLDRGKVYRIKRDKVKKFCAFGSKISGMLLKNPESVGGGRCRGRRCKGGVGRAALSEGKG